MTDSKYTVEHTTDEFGEDRWFVTDSNGDWVGEPHPTRESALEAIRSLEGNIPE